MSKIGKKPIQIPAEVEVIISGSNVRVKGPKGELSRILPSGFTIHVKEKNILVVPPEAAKKNTGALWGTMRKHIANMVEGVTCGFEKKLEFEGVGFRAEVSGGDLALSVGFTQPVLVRVPGGVSVAVTKNVIRISGVDKEAVGQFAANVRKVRPPEPYKGTGIKYEGEIIRRKSGKKLAGTAG